MPTTLKLPRRDGLLDAVHAHRAARPSRRRPVRSRAASAWPPCTSSPIRSRRSIRRSRSRSTGTRPCAIGTISGRSGLAVAEAMDTSQRGMGFDWTTAKELIKRTVAEAKTVPGAVLASGAGTDHLEPGPRVTIADVEAAYEEQCAWIEGCGGRIILMASRALGRVRQEPGRLREGLRPHPQPGARAGHHPLARRDVRSRAGRLLGLARPRPRDRDPAGDRAASTPPRSTASRSRSSIRRARSRCASGSRAHVRMYTGDDFDYPTTIRGDGERHSDALLGIFDVIAPAASAALKALDAGDLARYETILAPTLTLVAPRLRRAHALLQDGRRVRRLPERAPVALPDGRRAWRAPARSCTWPSSSC